MIDKERDIKRRRHRVGYKMGINESSEKIGGVGYYVGNKKEGLEPY